MKKKLWIFLVVLINVMLIAVLLVQESFLSIYNVDNLFLLSRDLNQIQHIAPTQEITYIGTVLLKNRDLITITCLSIMGVTIVITLILLMTQKSHK